MLYNKSELPNLMNTAGKITITTAIAGVLVFAFALIFDVGTAELNKVSAETASTTLTVLNTPPSFTVNAYEVVESSTSTPTNSGDTVQWAAIANDSNGAPYFLLVCSTNATPTARAASGPGNLGTNPPVCSSTSTLQWGVSAATPSNSMAVVSTTTLEAFPEVNNWYAWVCDDDPINPRCNNTPVQGFSATNSSPFYVNHRPVFSAFGNNGPVDPGGTLTFRSTSTDPDVVDQEDTIRLVVCDSPSGYSTTTNTCSTGFIASTTINVFSNPSATTTLAAIMQDDDYPAYGFVVDQHGHEASANPINQDFTVRNVAPVVLAGDIILNGIPDLTLTVEGGETPGFTLDFTISDANSCENVSSGPEITGYVASVFRTSIGTTTCNGSAGSYNPNNCYPSGVATSTWNLSCTQVAACGGPTDPDIAYTCTFPLWFVADPTDAANPNIPTILGNDSWSAGVAGQDDNSLTGNMARSAITKDLISLTALDLLSAEIPYGSLEPGDNTGTLDAATIVRSVGNTGLDQELRGSSMCGTYSILTPCAPNPSSTIPEDQQQFATSTVAYDSPQAFVLSSTTQTQLELNVAKSVSTTTPNTGTTYWGIEVPLSITLAGAYSGLNTFTAVTAEAVDWGY